MGKIVLLDELTSNQIAAGEVVEKPASVVKELVENSLDAGATSITVEIDNGGISYLRVTDNGSGIEKDDILIAFERHATSKIRCVEDLASINSFGFRGEALASIASVAQVEMVSKTQVSEVGNKVIIKGGTLISQEEVGCSVGTTIVIRELFFNTPARYKFLKKDYTEAGYVEDIITKIALINPSVSFKFINSKKTIFQTSGDGDIIKCIYNIYGKDIAKSVIAFSEETENIMIEGIAGKADIARSNRTNEIFFVNERYIKNKTMSTAVENAYQTIIPAGKFPFVIINVKLSAELVDVNVHPTKTEVRFSDENAIYRGIYHSLKDNLLHKDLIPDQHLKEEKEEAQNFLPPHNNKTFFTEPKLQSYTKPFDNSTYQSFMPKSNTKINYDEIKERNTTLFSTNHEEFQAKNYKIIGAAFSTYIIIQYLDDIYIVDQHAAHERVLYEKLLKKIKEGKNSKQILMIPEIINVRNNEKELIKNNIDIFDKAGFEIEDFGGDSIKISAVPDEIAGITIKDLFIELLDGLQKESGAIEEKTEYFIFTMACKAAVKANMNLNPIEIESLIDKMMKLENPFTCPHGRPTAIKISKEEMEKKFKRT